MVKGLNSSEKLCREWGFWIKSSMYGWNWKERSWLVLSTYCKFANALGWLQWRWFWALLRNVKAADKVTGFKRLSPLPRWTIWELFALFPILNESSFRTLTCLLAKAQEGNDAALAPSLLHRSSISLPQRTDILMGATWQICWIFWLCKSASGFL